MVDKTDVVVIGAGVVGCSIAYYLSLAGTKVIILEREAIGSGASAHATGSLGLLGVEFSEGPSFQLALAGYHEFVNLVPQLEEETGMNLLYQRRPNLRLALDAEEEELIKSLMAWQKPFVPMEWIGPEDVHHIEPRLTSKVRGAVYEEESAQVDSYRLTLALARAAEKLGAQLILQQVTGLVTQQGQVEGVRTTSGEIACDTVVVAAGSWSNFFEHWLHYPVPVRPLKGERLMLNYEGAPLPVLISSPKRGHLISRLDGLWSIGSTGGRDYDSQELFLGEEFDRRPTEGAKTELLQRGIDVLPALEDAKLVHHLAGSRPLSPDRLPIIGPVPGWDGVVLATGHTTKGIHLGPITGRIIADYILKKTTNINVDIKTFLPSRFGDLATVDFHDSGRKVEE